MRTERDWSAEISTLAGHLAEYYMLPEVASQLGELLRRRLAAGDYRKLPDEAALADEVTRDLQSVNGDMHLYLEFSEQEIPLGDAPEVDDGPLRAEQAMLSGHAIARVERLPGNVAVLDIRKFFDPAVAGSGAAAIAAMNLVASADALLLDLRRNRGGEPDMVTLVSSYLFDGRTHLFDLRFPAAGRELQYWTAPFVPGPALGGGKPVYVLTGKLTASAGEAIAYQLQQSGRGTVIGEPTAGGPVFFHYPYRVSAHLMSAVPSGYPVDPVAGTNWGETGVQPDIAVPGGDAFEAAYRLALEQVLLLGDGGARRRISADARAALAELS
ncbi:MAG: S41 family peptidase [Actinomycetota bacterium]